MTIDVTSIPTSEDRQVPAMPSAAGPDILQLDNVRFGYGDGPDVLSGISTTIKKGTIVGIVGPSGCGKSTLLYLIAGLLIPRGGSITPVNLARDRHALSMVFQKDTLLPWLSASENVRFFARFRQHGQRKGALRRVGRWLGHSDPLDARVESLLRMVHLEERHAAYPYQLSGGMRRRLQFLAGVAPEPQILLLDEPFSSVDEPTRIGIHQDVFEVMRGLNMTTLLVTHDLAEATTLCDRVIILSSRPAMIAHDHPIPFGEERDMLHIRASKEFLELYGLLWNNLSAEIASANATTGGVE